MCGEKPAFSWLALATQGSPPRVRGKVRAPLAEKSVWGITPACAGKSARSAGGEVSVGDHPRVCGEKRHSHENRSSGRGSPPRVRGKDLEVGNLSAGGRITPACAGKSYHVKPDCVTTGDHPRVCGEKLLALSHIFNSLGSPPRVRGKGVQLNLIPRVTRITPACAGKSPSTASVKAQSEDHPRVCGEKVKLFRRFPFQ